MSEADKVRIQASSSPRVVRNQAIEALRILSAFGIVVFHAHAPGFDLAYAGLVVFLALSPMFECSANWHRVRSAASLATTLLAPWAFWFVVYGLVNILGHKAHPTGWPCGPLGLLAGTSIHLWFLPFMFMVLVLLNAAKPRVDRQILLWLSAIVGTTLLAGAPLWHEGWAELPRPLAQWMQGLPAVFGGLVVGLTRGKSMASFGGMVALLAGLVVAVTAALPGLSAPYLVGTIALGLTLAISHRGLPAWFNVQPVADCMFGVYLLHPLALTATNRLIGPATLVGATMAFIASLERFPHEVTRRGFPLR
jgi:hypothetical protein